MKFSMACPRIRLVRWGIDYIDGMETNHVRALKLMINQLARQEIHIALRMVLLGGAQCSVNLFLHLTVSSCGGLPVYCNHRTVLENANNSRNNKHALIDEKTCNKMQELVRNHFVNFFLP